jgi:hypothetical protein
MLMKTREDVSDTVEHYKQGSKPVLSGEVFGAMINLSGRRRFTSQRIVLHALLVSTGNEGAIDTANEALRLFRAAHIALVEGNREVPGVFSDELREAYFGPMQGDRCIRDFMDLAERTLDALGAKARRAPALLNELVQCSTPLLNVLNQLTSIYEQESNRHAKAVRKQLHGVMSDIQTIAKQARMVSFNAQIIAARAGDAGREFSVVAGELSTITNTIENLVQIAVSESVA